MPGGKPWPSPPSLCSPNCKWRRGPQKSLEGNDVEGKPTSSHVAKLRHWSQLHFLFKTFWWQEICSISLRSHKIMIFLIHTLYKKLIKHTNPEKKRHTYNMLIWEVMFGRFIIEVLLDTNSSPQLSWMTMGMTTCWWNFFPTHAPALERSALLDLELSNPKPVSNLFVTLVLA